MAGDPEKMCFVIGPIGRAGTETRKRADMLLELVIGPAAQACGLTAKRGDQDSDPGSISQVMIGDVLNSRVAICDLTQHNPNAFYELGIRHAAGKPVINVTTDDLPLPFDNIDQRTLSIDTTDVHEMRRAASALEKIIRSVLEPDHEVHNPVTRFQGYAALTRKADTESSLIAGLQQQIAELTKSLRRADLSRRSQQLAGRYSTPEQKLPGVEEFAQGVAAWSDERLLNEVWNETLSLNTRALLEREGWRRGLFGESERP